MLFRDVMVESLAVVKPPRVVSSEAIERRLDKVYRRLKLPEGRLELMTGIRERRFWEPGSRSSEVAARAGSEALRLADFPPGRVGCLVHASVCRDFLEPATATLVHARLGLSEDCAVFDLSNACLGVLNAMAQIATMIDAGQIEAGLAVSGEVAEPLHEATVHELLNSRTLTRQTMKMQFASLTIGSAACAVLLTRRDISRAKHQLLGGAVRTDSSANHLCRSDSDRGAADPLMHTDSEGLLHAGCALAARTWEAAKKELGWTNDTPRHIFTHQVGKAHAKLTLETLGLDAARDFPTVSFMGNTGSAALPGAWAMGNAAKPVRPGDEVALLGIGSGLSSLMLGVKW